MDICDARRRCFRDFIHKHALCVSAPAAFEALLPPTVPTMSCAPALPCVDNPRVRSARDVPAAPAASPLGQTLPDLRGIAQQVRAHTPCPRKRVVGDMAHLLLVLRAPARTPRPRKRVVGGGGAAPNAQCLRLLRKAHPVRGCLRHRRSRIQRCIRKKSRSTYVRGEAEGQRVYAPLRGHLREYLNGEGNDPDHG